MNALRYDSQTPRALSLQIHHTKESEKHSHHREIYDVTKSYPFSSINREFPDCDWFQRVAFCLRDWINL